MEESDMDDELDSLAQSKNEPDHATTKSRAWYQGGFSLIGVGSADRII